MACITLLTDFGTRDEYAGVMKGVILDIHPAACVVDVSHGIAAQNVLQAACTLKAAFGYFPPRSVHVAVVDPGVGTRREIIAASVDGHRFLAPNNGLLWPIIGDTAEHEVFQVTNARLFRQPVSQTFHGRDIFAPVAAHLSKGGDMRSLGPVLPWNRVVALEHAVPRLTDHGKIQGIVVSLDRFGNIITNIHQSDLARLGPGRLTIHLGQRSIARWVKNYAAADAQAPVALLGSRNCLEIAVNGGSAAALMGVDPGDRVGVTVSGVRESGDD